MLPKVHRVRTARDFSTTVRSGARSGRRNVVLYAHRHEGATRFGFIVSKAVGNAVTRNLVKRRLRAIAAELLHEYPDGYDVVVRALPAAADAGWAELRDGVRAALRSGVKSAAQRASHTGAGGRARHERAADE
ncbi:ribonuclease P protein component [Zhihengliuella sp.]|uniref:ribonuclease P protein component n=1 Tax=Zhihengliuella sp. TaxID=1954483 RepID=UPI0028124EF3|nr:ribonuclease P protein component [Zhihengliuella sp.]